ncbi:hypothetical protein O2N63_07325 [Aliiroseovarius sp. KMU-50]|uniref:Uncharacterized protein n=1 Tax=Aliiroseovarius salicola TaxID=3009082 RepID=A0ABT4W1N2_9RHOB|nr:hypothetical protein [Aliiroseovarius sp. KMU-50]MDA5093895.1 hypothetical protein [Aliiroseovarius sp. KMU-50]
MREAFITCNDPSALDGPDHRVVIKTTRRKMFDKALLPSVIQSDPRFFRSQEQIRVCILPLDRPARRQGVFTGMGICHSPDPDEIELLEPFSTALRET